MNNTENKKERKKLIILIILVSVLLASLIITFFVLMYKKNEKNTNFINANNENEENNNSINASNENEENNNSINVNNDNEENNIKNPLLLDISFIKDDNIQDLSDISYDIKLIDNNLILIDNSIYDINKKEKVFDGSEYSNITYRNNYFILEKKYKYGLMNKDLEIIEPVEYYEIDVPSKNVALLKENKPNDIDTIILNLNTLNKFGPYNYIEYLFDDFIIADEKIVDIINNKESNIQDFIRLFAETFQDNYIITNKNYKYGVIDRNLNEIIEFKYNSIKKINNKFLLTKINNKYELIDINKNVILSFEYDNYLNDNDIYIENNVISLQLKDKIYYYDIKGNLITTSNLNSFIDHIGDNYYLLRDNENCCLYIDLNNNTTKNLDYSYCDPLFNVISTGYIYKEENNKYILYDNKLNKLSDVYYDYISLYDNYFIGEINDLYYIISYDGNKIIDKAFINKKLYIFEDENNNLYYFKY